MRQSGRTIAGIEEILAGDLDRISVERVAIGLFFTGVKLNTGAAGACATPLRSIPEAVWLSEFRPWPLPFPGRLRGRQVPTCCERPTPPVAYVARRGRCDHERPGRHVLGASRDARRGTSQRLSMHTTRRPFSREKTWSSSAPLSRSWKSLKRARQQFTVLENGSCDAESRMSCRTSARLIRRTRVLPSADVVLITGTTLVNDTLDHLLGLCRPAARVVVVGPTVGCCPTIPASRCRCASVVSHANGYNRPAAASGGIFKAALPRLTLEDDVVGRLCPDKRLGLALL